MTIMKENDDNLEMMDKYSTSVWYKDIVCFLLNLQCPPDYVRKIFRSLKLKAQKYCIIDKVLFLKDLGGLLLRCID